MPLLPLQTSAAMTAVVFRWWPMVGIRAEEKKAVAKIERGEWTAAAEGETGGGKKREQAEEAKCNNSICRAQLAAPLERTPGSCCT